MIESDRESTACFSGHRALAFPFSLERDNPGLSGLVRALVQAICGAERAGIDTFVCGGAWGFDILAGETVLQLTSELPIRLSMVIPFEGQERSFSPHWRQRYQRLLAAADSVEVLMQAYCRDAYFLRNRRMVECASRLICYYNGGGGGTGYTVKYGEKQGLTIVNLFDEE